MRVAVVGAGVVGVCTAYELATLGHEVSVFDRRTTVAAEASFAPGGLLSPALVRPWPAAGWWPLRRAKAGAQAAQRTAMLRLALFSQRRLLELTRALRLDYEQMPGCMLLLRTAAETAALEPLLAGLRDAGIAHDLIDIARVRQLEPALNEGAALHAALHLPQDGYGNCRQFAQLLKAEAQRLGAVFHFDSLVHAVTPGPAPKLQLAARSERAFDAVVLCAGADAATLLRKGHLRLQAVHGWSVTAPLRHLEAHPDPGPRAMVVDHERQVSISRLGQRLRIAGGSERGGSTTTMNDEALQPLYRLLEDWFPGAAHTVKAQHWKGARAVLADGAPALGPGNAPGVWLNLGHGDWGWTLACGAARVLAEQVSGRPAPLDVEALSAARLR